MKKTPLLFALCAATLFGQTAETIPFRAILQTGNEVPPTNIEASGAATVLVHVVRDPAGQIVSGSVDFLVGHTFPPNTTVTGMHIHRGAAGTNGPVTIDTGISGGNPVVSESGRGRLDRQAQIRPGASNFEAGLSAVKDLLADPSGFYVNVHTTQFPGGAIRGQLMRAEMAVLLGQMSNTKEVPPVTTTASGLGATTVYATRDGQGRITSGEVVFDVAYTMPEQTTFTGLHIHRGSATESGPVTIGTDLSASAPVVTPASGAGAVQRRVEVNVATPAALETLERLFVDPQNFYVNIHSTVNPGGVMRSQLTRAEKFSFPVLMSAANEVPALPLEATAPGAVTVYALRGDTGTISAAMVDFDANYRFPGSAEFTGFHIHNGPATENGGVTINTGLSATNSVSTETGFGNISRTVLVGGGAGLATLNSAVLNPERHYINLHTTANPGGAVRAQLGASVTAAPVVNAIISAVSDPTLTRLAPGGQFTIFGTNLTRVSADLTGFTGQTLPTSVNGVSVMVADKPALLITTRPGYIVAQLPLETVPGNAAVVVTTPAGSSAPRNVPVVAAAPAIYFDGEGAIATDLSYRLIRAGNPARAGDRVWVYSTGMGQVAPPMQNGSLALTYGTVSGVSATVGGRAANVVTSVSSPGFPGLYQTLLEIPAGTPAGNQPIVLTVSGNSSNAPSIPVR